MALVFDYDNIKVDFLSKALDNSSDKYNTKTILFPVLRYKIYAPSVESLELNIFQKSVLSILNKGKYDNQQISIWLQLDTQLVQMIFAELIQKRFISSKGDITETGRALIEESFSWFDNAEDIKKDIYYIYQDIYSQNLYPVLIKFDTSSDFFEYENRKIQINSKGKNKAIPVSLLEPKSVRLDAIQQPEVEEVFQVIEKHSKIEKIHTDGIPPNLIQFVDNEATVAYLATTIYIDKEDHEFENIKVLDPFCINEDVAFWLKESLVNASKKNDKIRDVFSAIVLDAKKEKQGQITDALKDVKKEAVEIIESTFDYSLKLHDDLNKSLEEFYRDLKLYDYHNDGKYLKEAFKNSQTVLETLFKRIYYNNIENYKKIQKHNTSSNIYVFEVEKKVKKINDKCEIPIKTTFWKHEKFKDIRKAMRAEGSLRAKYIGAILAAYYDSNNFMYKIMNQKDDILVFLEKVAEGRNEVGHKYKDISDRDMKNYANEVFSIKDGIEEIIKIFLEGK
jgi:hypothetical protein